MRETPGKKDFLFRKNRYYEGVCNDLCVRDTCMSSWLSYDLVRSFRVLIADD